MRVVWGDGDVTLVDDGEDDSEALSADEVDELAEILAESIKLEFVLRKLAAQVEEHWAAGRFRAAKNAAAVLAALTQRTGRAVH